MKKIIYALIVLLFASRCFAGGLFSGCMGGGFGTHATYTYLLDENCADITDWTDGDTGTSAESSQVTFDSRSTMKLTVATAGSTRYARRYIDVGDMPTAFTSTFTTYCDSIGTIANSDQSRIIWRRAGLTVIIAFASDGLFTTGDGSAWTEIGTNVIVQDTWQSWKIVVDATGGDASATVDVYLNNALVASDVDCSHTGTFTDGKVEAWQKGYTTSGVTSYIDDIKVYY